jgi:putative phosphoribosyl transferase
MEHFLLNKEQSVKIPSDDIYLDGLLYIPKEACGLVLFVHGSGSSRFSTRNQYVATVLNGAGLATLLFDLFTLDEEDIDNQTRQLRFDIRFLASRLIDVTTWCGKQPILKSLNIGYFGASTGGGAALFAAAIESNRIHAIVSRGGRPDLAGDLLSSVHAPTLLIVGGKDDVVIRLNQEALKKLNCSKKMNIIPGATHLFEEAGALKEVAHLAKDWFVNYLKC